MCEQTKSCVECRSGECNLVQYLVFALDNVEYCRSHGNEIVQISILFFTICHLYLTAYLFWLVKDKNIILCVCVCVCKFLANDLSVIYFRIPEGI
jgi:hypothetical protein